MGAPRSCVGGTAGIGMQVAKDPRQRGHVYLTGRTMDSAQAAAHEIGLGTTPLALDLSDPESIASALSSVEEVDDSLSRRSNATRTVLPTTTFVSHSSRHVELVGYTETFTYCTTGSRCGRQSYCSVGSPWNVRTQVRPPYLR